MTRSGGGAAKTTCRPGEASPTQSGSGAGVLVPSGLAHALHALHRRADRRTRINSTARHRLGATPASARLHLGVTSLALGFCRSGSHDRKEARRSRLAYTRLRTLPRKLDTL